MSAKKHLIEFFIGDWSDDGHGKGNAYYAYVNKSVNELREIYFAASKDLKIRLDGSGQSEKNLLFPTPCSNYEDRVFPEKLKNYLKEKGVTLPEGKEWFPEDWVELIFNLIKWKDSSVEFEILKPEPFYFYGFDKKKRHIGHFGYGLFI